MFYHILYTRSGEKSSSGVRFSEKKGVPGGGSQRGRCRFRRSLVPRIDEWTPGTFPLRSIAGHRLGRRAEKSL